jgi:hypothetical protein
LASVPLNLSPAAEPAAVLLDASALLKSGTVALLGACLAVGLVACQRERDISVRVSIPGPDSLETPAAGVGVIALPYDRDSVLASLEARAPIPRPPTAALESLFAKFRGPFTTYTSTTYAAGKLRDSLSLVRSQLDTLSRQAPQYRLLRRQLLLLSDSVAATNARAERARVALDRARAEFVSRSESLRARVRHWEDSTYRGYDSIVENLTQQRHQDAATDTTGPTGWAHFSLKPGKWWLYARAWDTSDPNAEWYWNVPVDDDTLLLSSRTGRRRPRY